MQEPLVRPLAWAQDGARHLKAQTIQDDASTHFAGFWRRVCARFVDLVQLSILGSAISLLWVISPLRRVTPVTALFPIQLASAVMYEVICVTMFGGTIGKLLFGMRIVDERNVFIGRARAVLRSLSLVVSALILGVGFVIVIFDSQKRGLHDWLCKTRVVTSWRN
jgi:uncharacterized RDD family membrane protein YckC